MKNSIGVKVTYRNEQLDPVSEHIYTLQEYADMMQVDLMRLITDVENVMYEVNGNRAKEEWSDVTWAAFQRIKHKLLDKAGSIKRMPDNLVHYCHSKGGHPDTDTEGANTSQTQETDSHLKKRGEDSDGCGCMETQGGDSKRIPDNPSDGAAKHKGF